MTNFASPMFAVLMLIALAVPTNADTNPPTNLMPPDGALGIPLATSLSWTWEAPVGCPEGIGIVVYSVYLGTDPGNLSEVGFCCNEGWPQPVGPLDPGTVYYWQVRVIDTFWDCPGSNTAYSVIQSFTTTDPVWAELSTWGRIKSLYR